MWKYPTTATKRISAAARCTASSLQKNARYAPRHYVEQAAGKFLPHSDEEQIAIMRDYCRQYKTDAVVCYCHYCLEGLLQGGVDGRHLAHLILPGLLEPADQ